MTLKAKKKKQSQLIAEAKAEGIKEGEAQARRSADDDTTICAIRWCNNILIERLQYLRQNDESRRHLCKALRNINDADRAIRGLPIHEYEDDD